MHALLGIDLGTTGVKAALFAGQDGALISSAFVDYPLLHPQTGWAEQRFSTTSLRSNRRHPQADRPPATEQTRLRTRVQGLQRALPCVEADHQPTASVRSNHEKETPE
jgi:hypothetical protein